MKLNYKSFHPLKLPVVIVHGLFGSAGNWQSIAKQLGNQADVYCIDLRNHGDSPHDADVSFEAMADDLAEFIDVHCPNNGETGRARLVGHSMGGKVAMRLALTRPERVHSLIAVDIAPVAYQRGFRRFIDAMLAMQMDQISSRRDADAFLAPVVEDAGVRSFLLHNLRRDSAGEFYWRIGIEHIARGLETIAGFPDDILESRFDGPALFLSGGNSTYVRDDHMPLISRLFPAHEHEVIADAGHWLHAEKPAEVISAIRAFFAKHPPED